MFERLNSSRLVQGAMMLALIVAFWQGVASSDLLQAAQAKPAELVAQGDAALAKNDEETALTAYVAVLRTEPLNVGAKLGRAEIAMRRELYPQAIVGFTDAIVAEPTKAAHYARRAAAYAAESQYAAALADWTAAIERDENQPTYWLGRGEVYLAQRNTDSAVADFVACVRGFPDFLPGLLRLADTLLRVKHDLSRAVGVYNDALILDPQCVVALVGRGVAYLQDEQYTAALRDLSRALTLQPDQTRALSLRGDVELVHGNYREAVADYRKATELEPRNALFQCDLGVALARSDDFVGAVQCLTRATKLDPAMSRAHVYLAVAEFSQGNEAAAQTALEQAKRLDGKWKNAKLERRRSRYIAFANGTDKPVEVQVWYFTDAVDGTPAWFPSEPGKGDPIVHKIKPRDTLYPAYSGNRLPVTKLRFTVRADDGSFNLDEFREVDLNVAPPQGYIDIAPQTFSFPIVAPEK
jgi:tetratricopeptide (TPR) repeat protein